MAVVQVPAPIDDFVSLKDRTAIVTGGAMGIGLAIAHRLGEAGAAVVIADVLADRGDRAVRELTAMGYRAVFAACDVSRESDVKDMVDSVARDFGTVDILVNNAAVFPFARATEMSGDDFLKVFAVNLRGPFICSREASRQMIARGRGGSIVNVASVAGIHPSNLKQSAYDSSKGGLISLTRSLALELGAHRIRVNAVCPGAILTGKMQALVRRGLFGGYGDDMKAFALRTMMGRMGTPDEIARVVLFLASDLSAYMTGSCVIADGGFLLS